MLVVDLGFSSAKWLGNNKKGMIKSCYRRHEEGYLFRGDRYLIGERALLATGSRYLRTVEELIEFYPLFVSVAAERAGIQSDKDLVVGLPYDYWKKEVIKRKRGATNIIDTLKESLSLIELNGIFSKFENVTVYPQGLGGIKWYLKNHKPSGNILALDIGFNTVISTLYSCSEGEILAGTTYYRKGLHDMATNLLMPEITRYLQGRTLTPIEVDYIMHTGHIQVGFDLVDVRSEIQQAVETYVSELLSLVIGDLKASGGIITFDTLLLFGGGARHLQGKVEAKKVQVVVLDEPEFANTFGFEIKKKEDIESEGNSGSD